MQFDFNTGACILGIDAGPIMSGIVIKDNINIKFAGKIKTADLFNVTQVFKNTIIEEFDTVHGSVGLSVIHSVFISGRLFEFFKKSSPIRLGRSNVKSFLKCKNDKEIREKLLFIYGKEYCKDVKRDAWAALALIYVYENLIK